MLSGEEARRCRIRFLVGLAASNSEEEEEEESDCDEVEDARGLAFPLI